jgi:hypothetical protein
MQPMNYTIDTGNAGNSFAQGFQNTAGMMATAADYQKSQQMMTLAQQKAETEQYKRQRFQQVAQNPTMKDVQQLMLEFPELHEGIGKVREAMSTEELRNTQQISFSVLSALEKDKGDAAIQLIDQQIEAAKKSGDAVNQDRFEILRNSVVANPDGARFALKGLLFSTMGGKEYGDMTKSLEGAETERATRDADVRKGVADASKAETDAQYAGEKARTDIANTKSTIEDRKFDQRIKVMEAQLKSEDNTLKREELQIKIDEAKMKRDETSRMKTAEADSAISAVKTTQSLLSDVLGDEDTLRAATGAGAWRGAIPGTESRAMAGKLEQLQNALAAENLDRLKGAMSDKDIMFIKNISANLDRYQDEDKLVSELKRVQKVLADAEARTLKKYGREGSQEQPAAPADPLSRLMQKYGVK